MKPAPSQIIRAYFDSIKRKIPQQILSDRVWEKVSDDVWYPIDNQIWYPVLRELEKAVDNNDTQHN
jgi:hypothetical protein